ncbi:MAG: hypothetical protein WC749_02475 [Dehalococcoidia bacterium]
MAKTLVLKNDFHNTQVNLRVKHDGAVEVMDIIKLTPGQVKKSHRSLCGSADCTCSGDLGTRAPWHELGGVEVKLSIDTNQDGSATLAVEQIWVKED